MNRWIIEGYRESLPSSLPWYFILLSFSLPLSLRCFRSGFALSIVCFKNNRRKHVVDTRCRSQMCLETIVPVGEIVKGGEQRCSRSDKRTGFNLWFESITAKVFSRSFKKQKKKKETYLRIILYINYGFFYPFTGNFTKCSKNSNAHLRSKASSCKRNFVKLFLSFCFFDPISWRIIFCLTVLSTDRTD